MRIDLLCSGSKGNSCLIRHEDTQLLIDCGSTKKYLMESFKKVGACVDDTNGSGNDHRFARFGFD